MRACVCLTSLPLLTAVMGCCCVERTRVGLYNVGSTPTQFSWVDGSTSVPPWASNEPTADMSTCGSMTGSLWFHAAARADLTFTDALQVSKPKFLRSKQNGRLENGMVLWCFPHPHPSWCSWVARRCMMC